MRDHVTEERISAYVDGELEGDELKLVEDLLAESAEHRQLLAEFQAMRASIWALPSFNLSTDFHKRVVGQIDELLVSPAKEPVRQVGRKSSTHPWIGVVFAAASLAAVFAFTLILSPATRGIAGRPSAGTPNVYPVYFQDDPQYVMVYDLTVTPAGQENDVVDKSLRRLGIRIDPALRLSKKVEKNLMVIRESNQIEGETELTPYTDDPATPKSLDNDKVEMIYIEGTVDVLDQLGIDLEEMRKVGKEVSRLYYDIGLEPKKLGVMHRLHYSAREHFANNTNSIPSDVGQAFRLSFHLELTSVSVPGAAAFPIPTIRVDDARPRNDNGRVLLIIRNVGAN